MGSLEANKVAAAALLAGIAFVGATLMGDALVRPKRLEHTAIHIDLPAEPAAGGAAVAAGNEPPIAVLLASADAGRGEAQVKGQGCVACHSFNQGGKAGVGPNLYGVVGAPHGHSEGFAYSAALKGKQGPWTFDEMNEWLLKPSAYAPGTKMSYAGLADPKKRADIIEYLRTLSPNPEPRPAAPANAAAAGAAATTTPQALAAVTSSGGTGSTGQATPGSAPQPAEPIEARLASASVDAGKTDTMRQGCIACHSFNEGGRSGVGPNLYGVVGGPQAHMDGFAYSAALKGKGGKWSYDELDKWLTKPAAYAPGTKMTFVGVADPKVRADLIMYLRSLSSSPEGLPAK